MKIYTTLPAGWVTIPTATMAPRGYVFICNNKSRFRPGRVLALLKID